MAGVKIILPGLWCFHFFMDLFIYFVQNTQNELCTRMQTGQELPSWRSFGDLFGNCGHSRLDFEDVYRRKINIGEGSWLVFGQHDSDGSSLLDRVSPNASGRGPGNRIRLMVWRAGACAHFTHFCYWGGLLRRREKSRNQTAEQTTPILNPHSGYVSRCPRHRE